MHISIVRALIKAEINGTLAVGAAVPLEGEGRGVNFHSD